MGMMTFVSRTLAVELLIVARGLVVNSGRKQATIYLPFYLLRGY